MATVNEKMTAIADNIRALTGGTEALTLDDMASGVNDVYEEGKKAQYEWFWDTYLKNSRESVAGVAHVSRFAGSGWNDDTFYPTQDIYVRYGYMMFFYNRVNNIKQRLEECGVKLIFNGCNDVGCMFEGSSTTELPIIELNKVSTKKSTQRLCYYCSKLVTIEKIIADEANLWGNSFYYCSKLENVVFEGVIGASINFAQSPLTVASMKSIISCLKDCSTTDSFKYTLTLKDSCKTELEADTETVEFNGQSYTYFNLISAKGWNLA